MGKTYRDLTDYQYDELERLAERNDKLREEVNDLVREGNYYLKIFERRLQEQDKKYNDIVRNYYQNYYNELQESLVSLNSFISKSNEYASNIKKNYVSLLDKVKSL